MKSTYDNIVYFAFLIAITLGIIFYTIPSLYNIYINKIDESKENKNIEKFDNYGYSLNKQYSYKQEVKQTNRRLKELEELIKSNVKGYDDPAYSDYSNPNEINKRILKREHPPIDDLNIPQGIMSD